MASLRLMTLALLFAFLLQYASLRGGYALLDSPLLPLPCAEPSVLILGLTRALAGADIRGCCGRGKGREV